MEANTSTVPATAYEKIDQHQFRLAERATSKVSGCMMRRSTPLNRGHGARQSLRAGSVAAALLLFTLVVRAIGWGPSVINPDESIFSLAAREVLAGHLPYTTLFDNKPVGSTLILASAFALFGQAVLVTRLVGAAFVWASGMLVAALLRSAAFSRKEALAGGIVQIAYASAIGLGGQATLTETMLTPFTALAALLLQRLVRSESRQNEVPVVLAAGLACGVAVLIKIVPLLPGLTIAGTVVLLAIRRGRITLVRGVVLVVLFGGAALAPMLVAAGVYGAIGLFDQFWWSNFGFAGAYTAMHPKLSLMAQRLGTTIDVIWPLLLLALAAVLDAAFAWRRQRPADEPQPNDGPRPTDSPRPTYDLLIVALAWLAAELVTVTTSLQFYPHYFLTTLPPLAVLAGFGLRATARWVGAADRSRTALVLGGLAALIAVERTQVDMARDRLSTPDVPRQVASAIRKAGGAAPTLFVTNYKLSGIYLLTGSPLPPTRFAVPAHLFSGQSKMTRTDPKVEVAHVLDSRPEFIVLDDVEPLPQWAQAAFDDTARDYRPFYAVGTVRVLRLARQQAI